MRLIVDSALYSLTRLHQEDQKKVCMTVSAVHVCARALHEMGEWTSNEV